MRPPRPPVLNYVETISIADEDGGYAGYVDATERHGVFWIRIYVKPSFRKRGLALLLAREALRRWGQRELWVNVWAFLDQPLSDDQLKILYRRCGFQDTDVPGIMRRPPS